MFLIYVMFYSQCLTKQGVILLAPWTATYNFILLAVGLTTYRAALLSVIDPNHILNYTAYSNIGRIWSYTTFSNPAHTWNCTTCSVSHHALGCAWSITGHTELYSLPSGWPCASPRTTSSILFYFISGWYTISENKFLYTRYFFILFFF